MSRRAQTAYAATLLVLLAIPGPDALAQNMSATAVVIHDKTPIRAGAGRSFYIVGELPLGTEVIVEEVVFGWHKIQPPPGTYSYISRAFVDAYGDGQTGRINTNRAAVRTASINGPGESYRRQIDLLKNDTVQIVAEEGSFYKIIPPDGAYVFLPPGTIRSAALGADTVPSAVERSRPQQPVSAETPANASQDNFSTNKNSVIPSPTASNPSGALPDELAAGAGATVSNETPAQKSIEAKRAARPASAPLKEAEQRLQEIQGMALEDQPLVDLFNTYQRLATEPNLESEDRQIITVRIAELRHRIEVADALRQIAAARENIRTDLIQEVLNDERLTSPPPQYDARGRLQASGVYNGNTLPQLFRVVEPASNRIITYIRLQSEVDPSAYVGKYVGVAGQTVFDPVLKLRLIEVEHLDVIELTATR